MTNKQAAALLRDYNAWRRGNESPMTLINMQTGRIGKAIDVAIKALTAPKVEGGR